MSGSKILAQDINLTEEDNVNDFLKQVREEKIIERSNQTNKNWINFVKDCRR